PAMKKLLAVVVLVVLVLLAFISSRPGTYHIERSATLAAPPEAVYARVSDLHQWNSWSPWAKLDPQMKSSFSGPATGVGSVYEWTGNDKVGQGRMTILDVQPPSKVLIKLEFLKPFAATCSAGFALAPEGAGTRITWTMDGTNNFIAKAFGLFMNMDKTVGGDFEHGLANLKSIVESATPAAAADSTGAKTAGSPS
ncbi:MAG: SRPBCC family protein, partial [Candidatus Eisenbacteria bacterium]